MTKKKTLIGLLLAVVLSVVCMAVSACAKPTMYKVEWTIPESVMVEVENYDAVPEDVAEGTVITFTVTPVTGYEATVKINKNPATATNGKYSFTVTKNSTVSITATEILSGIEVTANPAKLTYYAGDTIDTTGMVVKANYATGTSKVISTYSIRYTGENQAFAIGDTAFTVEYEGFTTQVNLDQAVVALVTINPVGGVWPEEFTSALKDNKEIANYSLADDGVISFTFTSLTSDIVLPETIAHKNGEEWSFLNWGNDITKIKAGATESYEIQAVWTAVLVTFNSVDLKMVDGKPCLLLGITLEGVDSAYLYLYEGNQKLEFVGDEINSANGGEVELSLDLSKLSAMEGSDAYYGAWMDIRVMTEISGVKISQELDSINHANPMAQVGKMIHDDNYCYRFISWNDGADDWLKIYFNVYNYDYEVALNEIDGKVTADFTGTISANALGNYALTGKELVSIAFGDIKGVGQLKSDRSFELSIDLTDLTSFNKTAGAITVYTSEIVNAGQDNEYENITQIYTDSTMDLIGCGTAFEHWANGSQPRWYRNTLLYNGVLYGVGVDWNELFITAERAEGYEINRTGVTLEVLTENDVQVPYLVILGEYGEKYDSAEQVKAILEAEITYIDLQNNSQDTAYGSTDTSWDMVDTEPTFNIVVADDGTYRIYVSLVNAKLGQAVYSHIGDNSTNLVIKVEKAVCNIGDTYYVLDNYTGWGSQLVTVYVTTEEYAPEIGVESVYDYDADLDNDFTSDKMLLGEFVYGSEGVATDGKSTTEFEGGIGGLDKLNGYVTYTFTMTADGKVDFVWSIAGNAWNGSGNSGLEDAADHIQVTIDGKAVDVSNIALPAGTGSTSTEIWWNLYQIIVKDVELTAGEHTFSCIITTDGSGLNVGSMKIYSTTAEAPTDYDIIFGEEGVADTNAGKWYFWNDQYWCGANVTVSSATYDAETDTATFVYTSEGSCWYGMQMFYQAKNLTEGKKYTLTCTITVETACEVTLMGNVISLNAGANDISIVITEPANSAVDFSLQMGKEEGAVMVAANTVSISGLKFEEYQAVKSFSISAVDLAEKDGKPCYIITGECQNYTEDDFATDFQKMSDWSYITDATTTVTINTEAGTFEIVIDLSTLEADGINLLTHVKLEGATKDVDFQQGTDGVIDTITVGGKVYTLKFDYATTWSRWMVILVVTAA